MVICENEMFYSHEVDCLFECLSTLFNEAVRMKRKGAIVGIPLK